MTYPNAVYSVFSFAGFVLCAIPFPWHLRARNAGTCLYMLWAGLGCLVFFINSIIWTGNAINWAPVWCDISSKFLVGVQVSISAASLCINRRLYHIACIRVVTTTKADKRRAILVDLAIGVGVPVLVMILHYIVQGHRFNIYEDFGCAYSVYYSWPAYFILYLPPIFLGLFSATYAISTIIAFYRNGSQFNAILSANSGDITNNRFIRLMCLASIEVLFNIPVALYSISLQAQFPLLPYTSWDDVHFDFSRVEETPSVLWRSNYSNEISVELARWSIVFCAFFFFFFFGFADEARKNYRYAFQSVAKRVGLSTSGSSSRSGIDSYHYGNDGTKSKIMGSSGKIKIRPVLPVFVHKEMLQRHSFDSLNNLSIADVGGALTNQQSSPSSSTYPEKTLDCCPDLSYGGTKVLSSPSSMVSLSSASSSITYPTPARTRHDSNIEISSAHRDSSYIEEPVNLQPTSNTSESPSQPRPTTPIDHSAV